MTRCEQYARSFNFENLYHATYSLIDKIFSKNLLFYAFWAYAFEAYSESRKDNFFTLHRYKKGKNAKFMPNTGNTVAKIFTVLCLRPTDCKKG